MPPSLDPVLERHLLTIAVHDKEAFRTLYWHYLPRIYAYVAYRMGRKSDAEDITAEVFLQLVKGLGRFQYRGDGSFAAWLFRIAQRCVSNHYRAFSAQANLLLDELPELVSDALSPYQATARKEQFARLYAHIGRLAPRRAEALRLRFFGGLRNWEIAQVMGLDERTVASHLSRAIKDLAEAMTSEGERIEDYVFE